MKDTTAKGTFFLDELFLVKENGIVLPKQSFSDVASSNPTSSPIAYHPFQTRYLEVDKLSLEKEAETHILNFKAGGNIGLITERAGETSTFITNHIVNATFFSSEEVIIYPLYYRKERKDERILNINTDLLDIFSKSLFLEFLPVPPQGGNVCYAESPEVRDEFKTHFTAIDLFDYLYAHGYAGQKKNISISGDQNHTVPFPKEDTFWALVRQGRKLRNLHLRKDVNISPPSPIQLITDKDNNRHTPSDIFSQNSIRLNAQQYFYPVSDEIWNFSIGGYFPARAFIKNVQGKQVSDDAIAQYKQVLYLLSNTLSICRKIDSLV